MSLKKPAVRKQPRSLPREWASPTQPVRASEYQELRARFLRKLPPCRLALLGADWGREALAFVQSRAYGSEFSTLLHHAVSLIDTIEAWAVPETDVDLPETYADRQERLDRVVAINQTVVKESFRGAYAALGRSAPRRELVDATRGWLRIGDLCRKFQLRCGWTSSVAAHMFADAGVPWSTLYALAVAAVHPGPNPVVPPRTSTAVALANGIWVDRAFDRMPILADALEDAGYSDRVVLDRLRTGTVFGRSDWVFDRLLHTTDSEPG